MTYDIVIASEVITERGNLFILFQRLLPLSH